MKIVVGSTSPHKLEAVREACQRIGLDAEVVGCKAPSHVNEQPVGFDETLQGAGNRATFATVFTNADVAIGIENGLVSYLLDVAVIVLITADDRRIVTTSTGVRFPRDCYDEAAERGFSRTTVGSVFAEKYGGDATDPQSTITKNKVSRKDMLVQALMAALAQI